MSHTHETLTACGCAAVLSSNGQSIRYCPLHAQAEGMRDRLRDTAREWEWAWKRFEAKKMNVDANTARAEMEKARAILRAVEGK